MPGYPSSATAEEVQRIQDREQLRLLVIGHYVYAGMTALLSLFALIYVAMGLLMAMSPSFGPPASSGDPPPQLMGVIFLVFGGGFFVLGEAFAAATFLAGRAIKQRKSRIFILVINAINCMNMPLGTLLGVFTFVVLSRGSVRAEFEGGAPDEAAAPRWPEQV